MNLGFFTSESNFCHSRTIANMMAKLALVTSQDKVMILNFCLTVQTQIVFGHGSGHSQVAVSDRHFRLYSIKKWYCSYLQSQPISVSQIALSPTALVETLHCFFYGHCRAWCGLSRCRCRCRCRHCYRCCFRCLSSLLVKMDVGWPVR